MCVGGGTDESMLRENGDPTGNLTAHNLHPDDPKKSGFSHLYG